MTQTTHSLASAYVTTSIPYVNGQPHVGVPPHSTVEDG